MTLRCAGADLDARVVLLMGICNIFADALSMGVGEYLSTKSSNEFALFERKREAWELENNFDGEVAEMVDIYVKRGMTKDDATVIVERMAKYPSLFVDIMMVEELGLEVPTAGADGEALREGLLMFAAFVALGLVPLLGYVALPAMCGAAFPHHCAAARVDPDARFAAACVVTSAALFGLGAAKARFVGRKWYALGAESLLLGAACAAVAYGTSSWLNGFLPKGLAG